MQSRRRKPSNQVGSPTGGGVHVPEEYWESLTDDRLDSICESSLARVYAPYSLILPFLGKDVVIDLTARRLKRRGARDWERVEDPLLELICLVYLTSASIEGIAGDLVSVKELKSAHFFQGPHRLDIDLPLQRYGRDVEGFRRSAERLGGTSLSMADAAYRIPALPKIPLYYLLWEGDDEFEPRMSVLFDRSVEKHLPADALWGLVKLTSQSLVAAGAAS